MRVRLSALIVAAGLAAPALAAAQTTEVAPPQRAVVIFGQGGGYSPLMDLDEGETAKGKTGWSAGGGLGVQLNRFVAVRGTFDYAKSEIEGAGAGGFAGVKPNHYFYGGDVQLRYPTASGFAPYLVLGAGALTFDPNDATGTDKVTKFAGKGGLGFEYVFPANGFGLFAQGTTYLYKLNEFGFDKTQADVLWTGGLSYRLGF